MDPVGVEGAFRGSQGQWDGLAAGDHVLQVYRDEDGLLDALQGFVAAGLEAGEAVVIVATDSHRDALARRLARAGIDVDAARASDRLLLHSAEETLDRFMMHGAPDEALFVSIIGEVLDRARGPHGRKVRAFGEMVALLWARGNQPAAVRLECLWNRLIRKEGFPLYCAYPRPAFTDALVLSVDAVCRAHTRVLA